MVDTIPTNLFEWPIATTLHIHVDSDACPHGFDSSTGAYLDVIFNELTIDVDSYLLQFVANILGDSNCASLAGIESNMCDYLHDYTNMANHDIVASGFPSDFAGDMWA